MKPCRFCAESIQDAAVVCPHCHREIGVSSAAKAVFVTAGLFALMILGVWLIS